MARRGRGRGRGRPPKVKPEAVADDETEEEEEVAEEAAPVGAFTCSKCKSVFGSEKEIENHIVRAHYGLARINDDLDTPFEEKELLAALKRALAIVKTLKCASCPKTYKSFLGYHIHSKLCGKEEEMKVECEVCHKMLMPGSIGYHMTTHKPKVVEVEPDIESDDDEPPPPENGRQKRASAVRASKFIRRAVKTSEKFDELDNRKRKRDDDSEVEFGGNSSSDASSIEDYDIISGEDDNLQKEVNDVKQRANDINRKRQRIIELWGEFVVRPGGLRGIPEGMNHTWQTAITKKGTVNCSLPGCDKTFTTKAGVLWHFKRCGMPRDFGCKICDFVCEKGQRGLLNHMIGKHKEMLPEVPDYLQEGIATIIDPSQKKSRKPGPGRPPHVRREFFPSDTENFLKSVENPDLFPHLMPSPSNWTALDESAYSVYKPQETHSASLRIRGSNADWEQIPLFGSKVTGDHLTFFAGGPIWSSAWAPLPLEASGTQYLALASCLNMEDIHPLSDEETELGLIQLWDFGHLTNSSSEEDSAPSARFALGIAHCYGIIWGMVWCPYGNTYQVPSIETSLPRLGLLCVGGADGQVRIFSVPHPDFIQLGAGDSEFLICKPEPVIILDPPGIGPVVDDCSSACRAVAWSRQGECNLIAAGYGSGVMAVWDINTKSPFLTVNSRESVSQNSLVLSPKNSWKGHGSAVGAVEFCPYPGEDYLASAGTFDRELKIWDLDDIYSPLRIWKKAATTSLAWSYRWHGIIQAFDECFTAQTTHIVFKDIYHTGTPNTLSSHRSCAWNVSFSDWLNSEASVDSSGEATVYQKYYYTSDPKPKRRKLIRLNNRLPLYQMKLVPLHESKVLAANQHSVHYTYSGSTAIKGIEFVDYDLADLEQMSATEVERVRLDETMSYEHPSNYPLNSLTQAKWNPNRQAFSWIFTGGQAGLCRISCFSALSKERVVIKEESILPDDQDGQMEITLEAIEVKADEVDT